MILEYAEALPKDEIPLDDGSRFIKLDKNINNDKSKTKSHDTVSKEQVGAKTTELVETPVEAKIESKLYIRVKTQEDVRFVRSLAEDYPGNTSLFIYIEDQGIDHAVSGEMKVSLHPDFLYHLTSVFGVNSLWIDM